MKTRFPNSRNRSQRVQPGRQSSARSRPPRPSPSTSPSPARTAPARRPTRSSPRTGAARSARPASRSLPVADRLLVGAEPQAGIAGVDADPDLVPVELQPLLDVLGRVLDRPLLEVLAEREVAEHLEERQVVGVEAHLVDVRGAEAPLTRRRQRRRAAARGRGSTASVAASRRSYRGSSGRRRAGSASGRPPQVSLSSKNAWNPSRSSAVVRTAAIVGAGLAETRRPPG